MSRASYVTPRIELLTPSRVGKHSLVDITHGSDWSEEGVDVKALIEEFGSPLFLLSERTLRAQFRSFLDAFTAPNVETVVAYSYKTNYIPAICAILHEEGAWAEVVSGIEYSLARSLGVAGSQIIFNGPHKTDQEIGRSIADGALINIDGFDELKRTEELARSAGRPARIGLRINFRHGVLPWTKFGFSAETEDVSGALEQVKNAGHDVLRLEALHNHAGTFQVDPKVYGYATTVLGKAAKMARGMGLEPSIIDLGGGYPSSNQLKPEFDAPESYDTDGSSLKGFAEEIIDRLTKIRKSFGDYPTLVLEPGRAVVDTAIRLACSVVSLKEATGQSPTAVIDAGVNILPTAYYYDHRVSIESQASIILGEQKQYSLFGPLCMQIDKVRDKVWLPELSLGDILMIDNVGAYCQSQSMQFIQPRPATVLIGEHGPELIQRREIWRDFFSRDTLSDRLRSDECDF